MRTQFSIVRAGSACPLFALASLALALAFTLSCSSGDGGGNDPGGNNGGIPFNENSQIYKSDNTKYTGSGNIKVTIGRSCSLDNNGHYTSCEWDDSRSAGTVNNGIVNLKLPEIPNEWLRDYPYEDDKESFEKSCPNFPWGLKLRQIETFILTDDNEGFMGGLEIHYSNDGQVSEEIQYWYFSKNTKITCSLEGNYVFSIDAAKGWNKIYRLRNYVDGKRTKTEYSTNNILPKEIKWRFL